MDVALSVKENMDLLALNLLLMMQIDALTVEVKECPQVTTKQLVKLDAETQESMIQNFVMTGTSLVVMDEIITAELNKDIFTGVTILHLFVQFVHLELYLTLPKRLAYPNEEMV